MKEYIRKMVLNRGADVCGFAGIDRFRDVQKGYSPADIFPECRTVISFGISITKGLLSVNPRLVYQHFNEITMNKVDEIALSASKDIESTCGCSAVPIPCDTPYEYWDPEKMEGLGLISMKYAAVMAGVGTEGKNGILLNKIYGDTLTLGAILIDMDLPSDDFHENVCIEGCHRCIDACPSMAISPDGVNQSLCRAHTYGVTARGFKTVDCNICRTVCPVKYGLKNRS